jgi:hypothetical protein
VRHTTPDTHLREEDAREEQEKAPGERKSKREKPTEAQGKQYTRTRERSRTRCV